MKVVGEIIGGEGRATRLGFPTFNILLPEGIEAGVYAGIVRYVGEEYRAVIFADTRRQILESHLLDFDTQEREPTIEVEILKKIRGPKSFPHDGELIEQIERDVDVVMSM